MKKRIFRMMLTIVAAVCLLTAMCVTVSAEGSADTETIHWDIVKVKDANLYRLYLGSECRQDKLGADEEDADGIDGVEICGDSDMVFSSEALPPYMGASIGFQKVVITDTLTPRSCAYWFYDMQYCEEIDGLENLDTSSTTSMRDMFTNCQRLAELDVSSFDTSKVTDMEGMFYNCHRLKKLNVSNFKTSIVTSMGDMFAGCNSLTELDVSNFDTSQVLDMASMFYFCSSLTELDVSNFDTSRVTTMNAMFNGCSSLAELDLSNFDTGNVTNVRYMFGDCVSLGKLDLSNFNISGVPANRQAQLLYNVPALVIKTPKTHTGTLSLDEPYYESLSGIYCDITGTPYLEVPTATNDSKTLYTGFTISYIDETITIENGYEVKDAKGEGISDGGKIEPGTTIYICRKENVDKGIPASAWAKVQLPSRPAAPGGLTVIAESEKGANDGKITGVTSEMEYRPADETEYKGITGDTIENLPAGTYHVRTKATATSFASEYATVRIADGDIPVTEVTLGQPPLELTVGDTVQLTVKVTPPDATDPSVTWSSSDESVVTVDENGKVTAVGAGTAIITVTVNGVTAQCIVTVTAAPDEEPENTFDETLYWLLIMMMNQKYDITASAEEGGTITPAGVSKVKYSKDMTYIITPDDGYAVADVIVDGESVGAVRVYTFDNVRKDHKITVIFEKLPWENPYADVSKNDWFYEDVKFATENGLMNDMGDGLFYPYLSTTRAMIVTILWRLEEKPVADYEIQFEDVPENMWYTEAIRWAASHGIVLGYDDGLFYPEKPIAREELSAILHRYAVYKEWTGGAISPMIPQYDYSEWAENDVIWADMNGLLDGIGSDMTDLTADASRAEVAAILRRFCERFAAE